ncbi:MAG: hypothetical protein QM727_09945 [Niabella sp.]
MKVLNHILHPVKKFSMGMFALLTLNLLAVFCVFIFDSCKKAAYERSDAKEANAKFAAALEANKKSISGILFGNPSKTNVGTIARKVAPESDEIPVYVQFPGEVTPRIETFFQNVNSIQQLASLIDENGALLQYDPTSTNSNYQLNLPIETITNSLNPLIQESKQYLYSRGFTEQDIQQMLNEENALETDLIPLVMIITQAENGQSVARNYLNLFPINTASAKVDWSEVGRCAIHAIGVDILFSLGASGATVWSTMAIKTAFKTVAKRMLGPIGVAIAVVDFGFCMGGVEI